MVVHLIGKSGTTFFSIYFKKSSIRGRLLWNNWATFFQSNYNFLQPCNNLIKHNFQRQRFSLVKHSLLFYILESLGQKIDTVGTFSIKFSVYGFFGRKWMYEQKWKKHLIGKKLDTRIEGTRLVYILFGTQFISSYVRIVSRVQKNFEKMNLKIKIILKSKNDLI